MLLRASAGARASSAAPVSEVWARAGAPERWVEFDPFLRAVEPSRTRGRGRTPRAPGRWSPASRCWPQVRLFRTQVPVEVDHVVNRSSLATTAHLFHGLDEEVEHLLIPQASGGTLVTARITSARAARAARAAAALGLSFAGGPTAGSHRRERTARRAQEISSVA